MPLLSTSQEDGHVKQWAAAGSPVPWFTCQNADVERDRGTRSLTGPQTPGTGDLRPTFGCGPTIGQNLSTLSCSL